MSILSVSEATGYIKGLIEADKLLNGLFIRGEISNFKHHTSGHCYFTLKDAKATLRSVMFRSRAQYLKFEPMNGMKVIAGGRISVFERDGQYQLYVEQLVPDGIGELSLAYEQLKEKLSREGLFDDSHKKPLPVFPRTVGIITSRTGAALRDIVTVSKRRNPAIRLVLYPVAVQGAAAFGEIAEAIRNLNDYSDADVLIVGRGGGSLEELWAFNEEAVVRAIYESRLPVISAVGHQTDYTLADFVADCRAATPSQAAELAVPNVAELRRHIYSDQERMSAALRSVLSVKKLQVAACLNAKVMRQPRAMIESYQQMLDGYQHELVQYMKQITLTKRQQFVVVAEKLAMLNPLAVLNRGYSIVQKEDKAVVTRSSQVENGEKLEVRLAQGRLTVAVVEQEREDEP